MYENLKLCGANIIRNKDNLIINGYKRKFFF